MMADTIEYACTLIALLLGLFWLVYFVCYIKARIVRRTRKSPRIVRSLNE